MKRSPMPARTTGMPRGPGPLRNPDAADGMFHRERRNAKRRKAPAKTNAPPEVEALVWERASKPDGVTRCEVCGAVLRGFRGRDYSLHHRMARGSGGSRDPKVIASAANLLAVCGNGTLACHSEIEAAPKHYTLSPGDDGRKIRHGQWAPTEVPVLLRYGFVYLDKTGGWTPAGAAA